MSIPSFEACRGKAEDCRMMALTSAEDEAKAFWLDLAERWSQCARNVQELTEAEQLTEESQELPRAA
jgi:hypothetical protein